MTKYFIVCSVLFVISACSYQQEVYSPLSQQEQQNLQQFKQEHNLNADCIASKLQVINRKYCDQESHYCNLSPGSIFSYQQWLNVYQSCLEAN